MRWGVRLLLALPLLALASLAHQRGYVSPALRVIAHRAALTAAGGAGLSGLRYAYPPVPVLLSVLLPADQLILPAITCLCSALILFHAGWALLRRVPWPSTAVLLLPLVGVPVMWYMASELLPAVIALAFLAFALEGFVRFAAYGETDGGFTAGIALALSYCADPGALLYGAVMCLFVPLVSHYRYHDDSMATLSIGAVLLFPILAVAAGWAFLVWRFSSLPGSLPYALGVHSLIFPGGLVASLGHAAASALADLAHVPLYLCAALVLAASRRAAAAGLLLPALALFCARWIGFSYTAATAYFMYTILALAVIAHSLPRNARGLRWLLLAGALAQVALATAWPPASPGFTAWQHAIGW